MAYGILVLFIGYSPEGGTFKEDPGDNPIVYTLPSL
jgi:hypothetical protein